MAGEREGWVRASAWAWGLVWAVLLLAQPAQAQAVPPRSAQCGACHGMDGNATQPGMPSLAGQPMVFLENTLVLIREGLREIPAMKGQLDGVSDAEISALARHFAAQKPAVPGAPAYADRAQRGAQLSRQGLCGSCHESDYRGREQIPRLAGQREDYLLASLRLFRSGVTPGRDTMMSAVLNGMSDADLVSLAHYLSHAPLAPR